MNEPCTFKEAVKPSGKKPLMMSIILYFKIIFKVFK
jgi:hypothetical protein